MTTRDNPLKTSLLGMQEPPKLRAVPPTPGSDQQATPQLPPSRQGKRVISGYFDPSAAKQLKMLSVETDRSVQSLLEEAIDDLFKKYGRSAIAS